MNPATQPDYDRDATRLLVIDPQSHAHQSTRITALLQLLRAGDLLVLNDAATLPASLRAHDAHDHPIEIRLAGPPEATRFSAVLFGAGDYHTKTEHRPAPPALPIGSWLQVGPELRACIVARSALSERLVELEFDQQGSELWRALYRVGAPVQYAYLEAPLPLYAVQTAYAARPWAAEMPSAGRPLSMRTLLRLQHRGVALAHLTHAAGLSSTGDPQLDRALPLPERYDIPATTVAAIARARQRGGRIVAVGTTVVRALESAALRGNGELQAGQGTATLRIDAQFRPAIADGLLSGIHTPAESHYDLLQAFADRASLDAAHAAARDLAYRDHEFGDASLILPGTLPLMAALA